MPKYKIALGMIAGDFKVHFGVVASLVELLNQDMSDYEFTTIFQNSIYVDRNRTHVGMLFLEDTDCDYLLLLDSDNGITKEGLDYFMEDFEDPDVNIVSGKYIFKGGNEGYMVLGWQPPTAAPYCHEMLPESAFTKDVINVSQELGRAVVGCGCLMIRKRVLEEVPYPWFSTPWVDAKGPDGKMDRKLWVGEDCYFSHHVQEHGFDIHFDQRILSPHYQGSKCYPEELDQVGLLKLQ
jgi:hypothetical protein